MIQVLNKVLDVVKTKKSFVTAQSDFLGKASVVIECYFGHWCFLTDNSGGVKL